MGGPAAEWVGDGCREMQASEEGGSRRTLRQHEPGAAQQQQCANGEKAWPGEDFVFAPALLCCLPLLELYARLQPAK